MLFVFDLLFLDGESAAHLPLTERKERLQRLFLKEIDGLRYSDHFPGDGPRFGKQACSMGMEGVTSKRVDRPYAPATVGSESSPSV